MEYFISPERVYHNSGIFMLKLMGKKIFTILHPKILFINMSTVLSNNWSFSCYMNNLPLHRVKKGGDTKAYHEKI